MKSVMPFLLLILLVFASALTNAQVPQRIVSLGLCTDQLLLMMVERERIASLTHTSTDRQMSYMAEHVGDIPINHIMVEEVIAFKPDLVVGSAFAAYDTVRMLKLLDYRVELVDLPRSIDEIRSHLRSFGKLVGAEQKAEILIREMDATIAEAQRRNAHKAMQSIVIYSPNGYTIGADTLENDVLNHAGFRNLSAESGISGFQQISLEILIASKPDFLQIDNHVYNSNSLASAYIRHPVLEHMVPDNKRLFVPSRLRACAGPATAEVVAYLADKR